MCIQLLVIFFAAIGAYFFSFASNPQNQNKRRQNYTIYICVFLILQSALRNLAIGADTYAYFLKFEGVKSTGWSEVFASFYNVYAEGEGKDAGYPLLQKIFQIFTGEYRLFLFFVAIVFFSALGHFLYHNTKRVGDVFFAVVIYELLFYSFFSITGLRQTFATAFTLWAVHYIKEQNFLKFSLLIISAAFIHKSVFLFYPFYFIAHINRPKLLLSSAFLCFPLMFVLGRSMARIMAIVAAQDNYLGYAMSDANPRGAVDFTIFLLGCGIMGLICLQKTKSVDRNSILFYNAIAIAIIFTPLTWIDSNLMRIVQYFSIFILLFLPYVFNTLFKDNQTRTFITSSAIIFFIAIIIMRNVEYAFMWEEMSLGSNY